MTPLHHGQCLWATASSSARPKAGRCVVQLGFSIFLPKVTM